MPPLTGNTVCRHDPLTEHDPSRIAIVSITEWLQLEWTALNEKFGSAALKHLPELAEKTPEFLKKFDELTTLKQQDVEQIQQLRGQIQQALKNREGELGDLDTRYSEKATEIQEKLAALETELANKTESCNMLDTQNEEAQRSLAIIEAQMAEQKEASKNHQSELRRIEKTVQTETTRLAMLTSECGTTDKRLTETREQILKAKESLDEERRSMNERVADYNRQIATRNAQIDQTRQGLEDREDQLTRREQQFNATSAQTEEAQIRGKQELEDDRMALQSERKKLQDDIEKAQHQWDVMWDYRNSKDGQVSNANEKADSLRASVAQHEEDRRKLQAVVRDRDSKLQEQSKNLTKANHSLDSMTKSRNDLAAESKRQLSQANHSLDSMTKSRNDLSAESKRQLSQANHSLDSMTKSRNDLAAESKRQLSQLQAAVNTQSELKASKKQNEELTADKERLSEKVNALEMLIKETGGRAATMHSLHSESMTSMNTLNDNIAQMLADQTKQMLASLQESAEQKTELISRVKGFEEVIIPGLKEQLGVAEGELDKAKEDSNATIEGLRTESGDLRVKLSAKEKELSECNTMGVLIASPEDKAALEKCRAEHSDVDALRQEFTELRLKNNELEAMCQEEKHAKETCDTRLHSVMIECDSAKEEISKLNQKQTMFEAQESKITELLKQQQDRDKQHQRAINTLEQQLRNLTTQESTRVENLETQLSECQKKNDIAEALNGRLQGSVSAAINDKQDLIRELTDMTIERDAAVSAKNAALKAQKDACLERAAMAEDVKQTSKHNRTIAEDLRKLMTDRNSLSRQLDSANAKADRARKDLEGLRRRPSTLLLGPRNPASQEFVASPQPETSDEQDEILDDLADEAATSSSQVTDRLASNSNFDNRMGDTSKQAEFPTGRTFRTDPVGSPESQDSGSRRMPQVSTSLKRTADCMPSDEDEHEERKRPHTGRDVQAANERSSALGDMDNMVLQNKSLPQAGSVLNHVTADGTITFRLSDIRDDTFDCDSVPDDLLSKLRTKLKNWDGKSKWKSPISGSVRSCVETRVWKKKNGTRIHGDNFACSRCEKAGDLCGLIQKEGEITLLPVYRSEQSLTPMDMKYWNT